MCDLQKLSNTLLAGYGYDHAGDYKSHTINSKVSEKYKNGLVKSVSREYS